MTELFENYRNNTAKTNINQKPIECLGMTFESDEERRQYFQNILAEKLKDPKFRSIEGFPLEKMRISWHFPTHLITQPVPIPDRRFYFLLE